MLLTFEQRVYKNFYLKEEWKLL